MQPSGKSQTSAQSSKRRTAIAIFVLFALPPLLAFLALKSGWYEKQPLTHHGVLLTPPLNASALLDKNSTTSLSNEQTNLTADVKKKWLLMTWIPEQCADACQSRVIQMGQMIQALGAERARVQTLYVTSQDFSQQRISKAQTINTDKKVFDAPQTITWIKQHQPRATITQVSTNAIDTWLAPVEKEIDSKKLSAEIDKTLPGLMIVDPMRQAMLYYPPLNSQHEAIAQGKNIIRDLQKLLKVSRIG